MFTHYQKSAKSANYINQSLIACLLSRDLVADINNKQCYVCSPAAKHTQTRMCKTRLFVARSKQF